MTFSNNSNQKERRQIIRNDRANVSTFHQFASSEANEVGGRFARPTQISGTNPTPLYPKLPASSPWSCDPVPPEEPLGIDISEPPVVGESFEVEQSLNADFGWRKTIRDGVPPSAGPVIPRASEPTPGTEVTRAHDPAEEPVDRDARHSPAVSVGAGDKTVAIAVKPAPTHPGANLIRRLV